MNDEAFQGGLTRLLEGRDREAIERDYEKWTQTTLRDPALVRQSDRELAVAVSSCALPPART